ncbi:unnamed protein product [Rotaria sordida]|uniref:RNA-dependent RNA polymerase n=1 Tax=Rotaria sordida TaxID=392033 RepID=A0A814BWQ2_9BILA|nr:unnamed protein product [Rotaria sordida]CAF0933754.1 unnamed protein product [Rotaria sordida]
MTKLYERIKKIMINGINICDRHYEFLAFSSSQLREHSCWMFASLNTDLSANQIREWMGDFSNIRPVSKMAARLGQSFSTTIKGIELKSREYIEVSDVIRGNHNFTDGIGIIAPELAHKLAKQAKHNEKALLPSAFQIRFSGYKGMVCLDVANKIINPTIGIYFRKSMNKFLSKNLSIDVVRMSSMPISTSLNRQIILLLSSLGIEDKIFLLMQKKMLNQIESLTGSPEKASNALRELNEFGGNGWNRFLIEYLNNFDIYKEPFVRQMLLNYQAFLVKELRTKSRISIKQSWNLLGVIDETRILRYGQVFIQINKNDQQIESTEILQGPVIVTRNPCFHPGDIRRLEAVDIPALHGLMNVIVFPIDGPRPHPEEMSGGDLDGDTFWICNDPQLIFHTNEEPFDYHDQAVEAEKEAQMNMDKQLTINDICNFFVEYIEADNLGIIANTHMAFADQLIDGCKAEPCLKLARMHSVAVDFAKNGVSAPRLTPDLRPKCYPHYMEKIDKLQYHSKTVLGQLYDQVESYKIDLNNDLEKQINETSSFPYVKLIIDGNNHYMKEASITKNAYDRELKRIMRQYGIKSEAEVLSGYILKFTTKQYAKQAKLFELRNEINHAVKAIREKYLRLFWEQFYQITKKEENTDQENKIVIWKEIAKYLTWKNQLTSLEYYRSDLNRNEIYKKASAWFLVTYKSWIQLIKYNRQKDKKIKNTDNNQQHFRGLFSFAWLVYPIIFQIFDQQKNLVKESDGKKLKNKKQPTK